MRGKELAGALGPDLIGVTDRRDKRWLYDWLKAPDQMLKKKDPIAMELYKQYNNLAMPNFRLNQKEATELLGFMEDETRRIQGDSVQAGPAAPEIPEHDVLAGDDVVAIMNSWVREARTAAKVNAGYMTLVNTSDEELTLTNVESDMYKNIEVHEMAVVDGLMEMNQVTGMVIPAKGQIQFEPGGKHLMLMGPKKHFKKGEEVDMTLIFK